MGNCPNLSRAAMLKYAQTRFWSSVVSIVMKNGSDTGASMRRCRSSCTRNLRKHGRTGNRLNNEGSRNVGGDIGTRDIRGGCMPSVNVRDAPYASGFGTIS